MKRCFNVNCDGHGCFPWQKTPARHIFRCMRFTLPLTIDPFLLTEVTTVYITERKSTYWVGEKIPASLSLSHPLSPPLSLSVCHFAYFPLFLFSERSVGTVPAAGQQAHPHCVFFGKWLWSLFIITLRCHCVVPLLISHSASQLHMAQRVLPPTPCLSESHSHRSCSRALCVVLWRENQSSTVFDAFKKYERILHGPLLYMLEKERDTLCCSVALELISTLLFEFIYYIMITHLSK